MMAVGVTMPTIEMHLISYGIPEKYIGFWYIIYTGAYLMSSFIMTKFTNYDKKAVMLAGVWMFCLAFFLLGPCPIIFERNVIIVAIGHHLMGWACSIQYSKGYLVPLIPYMIDVSHTEYHIPNDDRLNDAISGIANISICGGEIIGPIMGSLLGKPFQSKLKYRVTYLVVSLIFGIFGLCYLTFDNFLAKKTKISARLIQEEELSVLSR